MIVAIPSKSRAGKTTSDRVLPNATFYVPKSEVHQYEDVGIKNIVGVPNSVQGITPTRNWILKNTDEKRVVFVDDDVKYCGYMKVLDTQMKKIEMKDEEFWLDQWMNLFDVCEQMKFKIWGIKTESSPRSVYPYKPFLFKTYITASCMGIINDGEFMFDEKFIVKEDYEICLRHIVEKGGILGCRFLHWENSHWYDEGGCKDYRTIHVEREAIRMLVEKYPGMISSAKRKANEFTIKLNL
jgi:hypothetical protein